jgi:hypothetical protein
MMVWVLCGSIWSAGVVFVLSAAAVEGLTDTWAKRFCPASISTHTSSIPGEARRPQ